MFFVFAVLLSFWFFPSAAEAKPMTSNLSDILARSPTIVIATYQPPPAGSEEKHHSLLQIERTIRGSVRSKDLIVYSHGGSPEMGAPIRLVAFLTAQDGWVAFARPLAGPSLEEGVLHLEGFYDFNAHYINPGLMTLEQLEALALNGTPLTWTFRGKLLLPSPAGLVPSTIEIVATAPQNLVSGMPPMAGFAAPDVSVPMSGRTIYLDWDHTKGRQLILTGRLVGKLPDGSIAVEFEMSRPHILDEQSFRQFLATPTRGSHSYVMEIQKGKDRIPVVLGEWQDGTLGTRPITESVLSSAGYIRAAGVEVKIAPTPYQPRSSGGPAELIEELMMGPLLCTYKTARTTTPCTLRYVSTRLLPR